MGAYSSLDWAQICPDDPFLGNLPPCKISRQFKVCVATGDDFSFWLQTLPWDVCNPRFGRNFTSKFLMWCLYNYVEVETK